MRELTLILSDVYAPAPETLPPRPPVSGWPAAPAGFSSAAPTLDEILRYGRRQPLPQGWRTWLARRIGREDLAALAPAVLAALPAGQLESERHGWLATPVHLEAALDHVRIPSGGLLALDAAEARRLAADFASEFADSGLALRPLAARGWLLTGLDVEAAAAAETSDPARAIGSDIAPYRARGAGARALHRLGAELELWLHAHPLNAERRARRRRPLSTLWLWGGGRGRVATVARPLPQAWGEDPALRGLWQACGQELRPAASGFAQLSAALAGDAGLVELQLFHEAAEVAGFAELEARWLAPAVEALRRGRLARLLLLANDRAHELARADLWKFWRRPRSFIGAHP